MFSQKRIRKHCSKIIFYSFHDVNEETTVKNFKDAPRARECVRREAS